MRCCSTENTWWKVSDKNVDLPTIFHSWTGLSQLSYRYDLISRVIPQLLRVKKPVEDLGLHLDYIDALAHFTGTKLVDRWSVGGWKRRFRSRNRILGGQGNR